MLSKITVLAMEKPISYKTALPLKSVLIKEFPSPPSIEFARSQVKPKRSIKATARMATGEYKGRK